QIPPRTFIQVHFKGPVPPCLVDHLVHDKDDGKEREKNIRIDKVAGVDGGFGDPCTVRLACSEIVMTHKNG
ncbi:UNVERIFIED_CONTAM: hypothetical protein NY603_19560, partial [Bacteroidetes bacterium 56_B9]